MWVPACHDRGCHISSRYTPCCRMQRCVTVSCCLIQPDVPACPFASHHTTPHPASRTVCACSCLRRVWMRCPGMTSASRAQTGPPSGSATHTGGQHTTSFSSCWRYVSSAHLGNVQFDRRCVLSTYSVLGWYSFQLFGLQQQQLQELPKQRKQQKPCAEQKQQLRAHPMQSSCSLDTSPLMMCCVSSARCMSVHLRFQHSLAPCAACREESFCSKGACVNWSCCVLRLCPRRPPPHWATPPTGAAPVGPSTWALSTSASTSRPAVCSSAR